MTFIVKIYFPVPESGYSYLLLDIESYLKEAVILQWQSNGNRSLYKIPGEGTKSLEISFQLSQPGALGPISFSGYTLDGGSRVSLNDENQVMFYPTVKKLRQRLNVTQKSPDSFIIVKIINNANEDINVEWTRNEVQRTILVPLGSSRDTMEVFYQRKDEVPIMFTAHSHLRGKSYAVQLNGTKERTIKPTLKKRVRTLIAGDELKSFFVEFVNQADGPIVVTWIEELKEVNIRVEKGTKIKQRLAMLKNRRENPVIFSARRADTGAIVRLNGKSTTEYWPSIDLTGKVIIATDDIRHVIVEFDNQLFSDVQVSWRQNGELKSIEIKPSKRRTLDLRLLGKATHHPLVFNARLKRYNDSLKINGRKNLGLMPMVEAVMNYAKITSDEKHAILHLQNNAKGPVEFLLKHNNQLIKYVMKAGHHSTKSLVFSGIYAYLPITITARRSDFDFQVLLNNLSNIAIEPYKDKTPKIIVARDKWELRPWMGIDWQSVSQPASYTYIMLHIFNNATSDINVLLYDKENNDTFILQRRKQLRVAIILLDGQIPNKISVASQLLHSNRSVTINSQATLEYEATNTKTSNIILAKDLVQSYGKTTIAGSLIRAMEGLPQFPPAETRTAYITVNIQNDAGVRITVQWKENGMNRSRDIDVGETGTVEIVHSDGDWMQKEVKFRATRKDNGEAILLNGGKDVLVKATSDRSGKSVVATTVPGYIVAEFKNDAGVGIRVHWKENGMNRSRDIDAGETGTVEIVHSDGYWMNNEMKFTAMRKDNGETVLLNGGDEVLLIATKNKAGQSVVATNKPGYIIANFKNDAGVGITVQWKENGMNRSRDIDVGETGTVEIVHSDGYWMNNEMKFTAMRKDNGETVLLNGGDEVLLIATKNKAGQSVVATNKPGYIIANFKNDAGVGITVQWKENGMNRSRDIDVGETGTVEIVHSDGDWMQKEVKFRATRKDNGEAILLNGGKDVLVKATSDRSGKSVVATTVPGYIVAEFKNDAGVGIRVHWKENGMNRSRDIDAGETGTVEIVHSDGYWMNNEMKFTAMRKDNGETVLLNGGDEVLLIATKNKAGQSVVATNKPGYIIANFKNDAGVGITVQWKENGMNRSRDIDVGETGTVEIVHSDGDWMQKEVKFRATRKDNGEAILLNGGKDVLVKATSDRSGKSVVATTVPGYIVAEFKNDAGVGIRVHWKENGMNRSRDIDAGETGTVEIVHSDGYWMNNEMKFTAMRKDNGETVLLNGGDEVLLIATKNKAGQSVVATNKPGYIIANFKNDAGVGITVQWKENGMNRSRDIDVGETGTVEIVHSDGDWMQKEVKFRATRKDNGEAILLNGGKDVLVKATSDRSGISVVATTVPGYIVAEFKNDAGVGIRVHWKENGMNRSRDIDAGETGTIEIVHSDGYWMNNEMKFTAMRKDNGETVLLNGGDEVLLIATKTKAGQSVVATNKPGYIIANFKNDAGVGITVQWKENGMNRSRDIDVGETGTVEIVHSDGYWMNNEMKFTAMRKDNGEIVLLNGGDEVLLIATKNKAGQSVVATNKPGYSIANFKNDAGVGITVQWKENGMNRSRDIDVGETGTVEIVQSDGDWMQKEVKFRATRKDNGEAILLNGGKDVLVKATSEDQVNQ